ncbi:short-chain dehydrogenase/reductase 3 isoform X1 [Hippopotamus amphibius kiboko]|uniref:short-chain dehydrogenase/reductase 3 isoform X1 n=1 Tax=Hippopotamus amphibius kiboko TaxID=575201 RepID=UPI0025980991|nr:short-chain dehydrogenase/reductase 3 isoform X1 [Hippopotamus amphibius kiboko]
MHMIYLVVKAAVGLVLPAKLRDLSRENVLITGGGRGIGRQLAREFAERGARKIVLWGRTEKCLKETTEEIRQMGTECHYFICDVGNREEVYQTAKAVREKVGDITILVNNAAVVHGKSLMDSDDDALLKSQHINTLGQFWTTKAFLPRMLELQNGHIVCLNSVLALSAIPGAIDYCTSKASAFAFMESLTLGLLDCPGVSATTVLPFHTSTEMFQGMRVRFPNLFPPLKPETVARRTVEAVQLNQALLLLPWTMHALIILKRSRGQLLPSPCTAPPFTFPERNLHRLSSIAAASRKPGRLLQLEHTPTGCPRGDPQILRNLHLHEHFQRTDIKAGRRDRLESRGT